MTVGMPEAFLEEPDAEGRAVIRVERVVDAAPDETWTMLTDLDALATWFPCTVEVEGGEWVVGATLTFTFGPEAGNLELVGSVTVAVPSSRLAFTWGPETLEFTLTEEGAGTRIAVRNALEARHAARNAAGWDTCFDRLAGVQLGDWRTRFEQYTAEFEPILGTQEGPPPGHLLET